MSYEDWEGFEEAEQEPGQGQGVGKPRQGQGGFGSCVCPKCGYSTAHDRGQPCNAISCPKCGVSLQGGG